MFDRIPIIVGSRDHKHFWGKFFVRPLVIRHIQSRVSNLKHLAQVVLKICSIVCQKLYGSRDLGHAHFQGKLFVRLLGFLHTKQRTKFEVSSSSSFGAIDAAMVDRTLNDL